MFYVGQQMFIQKIKLQNIQKQLNEINGLERIKKRSSKSWSMPIDKIVPEVAQN